MSVSLIEANHLRSVEIEEIIVETPRVKTFLFDDKLCARSRPGQFIMVWLPGFDEIPLSISSVRPSGLTSTTVLKVGEATMHLHKKERGNIIGIRGPFGNNFRVTKGNVLLVGGGVGVAPLAFLAERLIGHSRLTLVQGAKAKTELLPLATLRKMDHKEGVRVLVSTEDGSYGHRGIATEVAEEVLAEERFDLIYACGKELMLLKMLRLAEKYNTPLQVSLERLMRCAIGLCGSCSIGKYRVCADGPVFTKEQLREVKSEFGLLKRDFTGRKVQLET